MKRRPLLLAILLLSVLVRAGSAIYQGSSIEFLPGVADQRSYHELALRVLDGHGFSFATGWWPATRANQPTAHWSFLYVLFLSGVYWLFGPEPLAARLIQACVVGVLQPWLAWRIGRRLFGEPVGLVAAGLTAAYAYFVYYSAALVTEPLFMVACLWVLDRATALPYAHADARARLGDWAQLGLAMGVAAVLRQAFVLVIPVIFAWLAWELAVRRADGRPPLLGRLALAGRAAVAAILLVACILPWTIRNYRAFDQFVLLNTNAGFVFFWANHPVHGTRFIPILPSGPVNYGTLIPPQFSTLNEAQLDRALLREGLGFVTADPGRYLRLSLSRAAEFFKFWPSAESSGLSNLARTLSFGLVLPFLVAGTALALVRRRCRSRSGVLLLVTVAGVYTLAHLLTWTLVRYRLPVDAVTMPLAAFGTVALFDAMAARFRAPAVAAAPREFQTTRSVRG